MRNTAERARGMRFDPPNGSKPPRNCRKVPVTRHGRAIAESEAAAVQRMRKMSRAQCGGTLGGVRSEGATSCGVWDSGMRLVSKVTAASSASWSSRCATSAAMWCSA